MNISGRAQLAGVIGSPVAHSLSPLLHNSWIDRLGLDAVYVPLHVDGAGLPEAVRGLKALGFCGFNVTIPHKINILPLLDSIDPKGRQIGAVNSVAIRDGRVEGRNSDAPGWAAAMDMGAPTWRNAIAARPVLILGAGGAARAVAVALADAGAKDILVINRSKPRTDELAADLAPAPIRTADWLDRNALVGGAGLIVNTTSLGMKGQPPLEIDLRSAGGDVIVNDIVYAPLETPLLAEARHRNLMVVDGLGMLMHQAALSFEEWFKVRPEVDNETRSRLVGALARRAAETG